MLKRTISDAILKNSSSWPVLLLTGPRQAGKSSVLNMLKEKRRKYVSLDDLSARDLARGDPQAFLQKYEPPVIIDEVQYAPNLFTYIKIWVDKPLIPALKFNLQIKTAIKHPHNLCLYALRSLFWAFFHIPP